MPEQKTILLLDDDSTVRNILSQFLQKDGYAVFESENVDMAVDIALHEKPDMLIADILMKGKKGTDVIGELQNLITESNLKVLFLTGILEGKIEAGIETKITVDGTKYPAMAKPIKLDPFRDYLKQTLSN